MHWGVTGRPYRCSRGETWQIMVIWVNQVLAVRSMIASGSGPGSAMAQARRTRSGKCPGLSGALATAGGDGGAGGRAADRTGYRWIA